MVLGYLQSLLAPRQALILPHGTQTAALGVERHRAALRIRPSHRSAGVTVMRRGVGLPASSSPHLGWGAP